MPTGRGAPGVGQVWDFFETYTRDLHADDLQRVFTRDTRAMVSFFTQGTDQDSLTWRDLRAQIGAIARHTVVDGRDGGGGTYGTGDVYGERRIFVIGVVGLLLESALVAIARRFTYAET